MKPLKELKTMDPKSLEKELMEAVSTYKSSAFKNTQGNLKDTSSLRKMRTHIARIKTLQKQKIA